MRNVITLMRQRLTIFSGKLLRGRGVQTGPGAMTLHLIFFCASSVAMPFVRVVIAPCRDEMHIFGELLNDTTIL